MSIQPFNSSPSPQPKIHYINNPTDPQPLIESNKDSFTQHVRTFSFQRAEVIDELLKEGRYTFDLDNPVCKRGRYHVLHSKKTDIYREVLNLPKSQYPIYSFYRFGGAYPMSIQAFKSCWLDFMRYYKFNECKYMLELYIPKSIGGNGFSRFLRCRLNQRLYRYSSRRPCRVCNTIPWYLMGTRNLFNPTRLTITRR